jgi:polyisoprenoid-binding protein YceI
MALEQWQIDTARSAVGFTVRHMVISKVHGRFTRWSGTLELDLDNLSTSKVSSILEASSIETRDALRDDYLRSADFLDPEKHPHLEFRSTRIEKVGAKKYEIRGDLTIRGVTREVVLDTMFGGLRNDPRGGKLARFEATTKIDRKDFGLVWSTALEAGGILVGDNVDIALEIEARKSD